MNRLSNLKERGLVPRSRKFASSLLLAGCASLGYCFNGNGATFTQLPGPPGSTSFYYFNMSANGKTFTGYDYTQGEYFAYFSAQNSFFETQGYPGSISLDGSKVSWETWIGDYPYYYIVDSTGGERSISGYPMALSGDGNIVLEEGYNQGSSWYLENLSTGAITRIPGLAGWGYTYMDSLSADGTVASGFGYDYSLNHYATARWTAGTGTQAVSDFYSYNASRDGSLVTGNNIGGNFEFWDSNAGAGGTVFPGYTSPYGQTTPDGNHIVGYGYSGSIDRGLIWDRSTGGVSNVGDNTELYGGSNTRFRGWSSAAGNALYQIGGGWTSLQQYFNAYGLASGWSNTYAESLTDDGTGILGYGYDPSGHYTSFYATLPLTPVAVNDSYSTAYFTELDSAAPGVKGNDLNASEAPAALVSGPSHANGFILNNDGSFSYFPAQGFGGLDSFTYELTNSYGVSNIATASIDVASHLTSITPSRTVESGSGVTITVNGQGFTTGDQIVFNGDALATTVLSSTKATATVPASDIPVGGYYPVKVVDTWGGASNSVNFLVANAAPVITSITPNPVSSGGPTFTLTVNGSSFVPNSVVMFNGRWLTTTYVSGNQLQASVPARYIATPGTAQISVHNPAPGGGNSPSVTLVIGSVLS